jgi:hypothetical protein
MTCSPLQKPSAEALRYLDNEISKIERSSRGARLKEGAELQSLRNYRKAWAKSEPQIAPFLGEWSDAIEGGFGIYPSSTAEEVCIIAPFSAYVTKGKIAGGVLSYTEKTGVNGRTGKNVLYNLGRETVVGARFVENSDKQLIPFFARSPVEVGSQRARIFEEAGCRIMPPKAQTSGNSSAQSIVNLSDGTYFYGQSPETNQVGKTYYLFKKRGNQATGLAFAPRAGDSPCFTGTIQDNQIKRVTLAFSSYDRSGKNANWSSGQSADYNFNGTYRLDVNQYRGDVKDEISRCQSGIAQVVTPSQPSSTSSPQANGQKGAVNLGGSSYFSWGLLKPESRDNTQAQIVMGYGCQTQNQLEGISQRASMSRYVIKRGRGSDDWWLESLGGVVVRPTPNGYVSEKVEGISSSELKRYITDSSSGFLKRDMDVDGLGNACINGGIQGALNYIQGPVNNKPIAQPAKPIAQPAKPLTPIAASNTYAYPSPQEFAQFKKTLRPSPVALSAADRKLRQDFQAEWQKKNPAIGPFVGAWKTADNQDIYVFPSSQAGRACVVEKKDGEFKAAIGVSMKADMRYLLTHGQFRVAGMTDVVAGRSDKSQPLSALYAAIGSPDVSSSVKEDLAQAKCVAELPRSQK